MFFLVSARNQAPMIMHCDCQSPCQMTPLQYGHNFVWILIWNFHTSHEGHTMIGLDVENEPTLSGQVEL